MRLLQAFPFLLPIQIVDKGAIRFILSGADIMCPGLTSKGAFLDLNIQKDTAVQVVLKFFFIFFQFSGLMFLDIMRR